MLSLGNGVSYRENGSHVLFDPHKKTKEGQVYISHGHSDHARKHDAEMFMTKETMEITGLDGQEIKLGKGLNGVIAHNAGHVIGSAQFETNGIVYTGDLLTDNPLLGGGKPIPCDDLIIEATFGVPEYVFKPREEIIEDISKWVQANHSAGRTVVLGGYALGKAQELTKIVSDLGITPLVHPKIARINQICENTGVSLGEWIPTNTDEANEVSRSAFVAVMPFHQVKPKLLDALSKQSNAKTVAALATGWANHTLRGFKAFALSDHADFPHLIKYVEEAEPKRVHVVHGFAKEFSRYLRRRGWNAQPLQEKQRTLDNW